MPRTNTAHVQIHTNNLDAVVRSSKTQVQVITASNYA